MTKKITQLNENFTDGTMHPHTPTAHTTCMEETNTWMYPKFTKVLHCNNNNNKYYYNKVYYYIINNLLLLL